MKLEAWFPTPVFFSVAPANFKENIEKEYFAVEQSVKEKLLPQVWGDNISATFNTVSNLIKECKLVALENYVISVADQFAPLLYLDAKKAIIKESWVNYSGASQYQERHMHTPGDYDISGVYYISTTEGDGNLRFHSPVDNLYLPNRKMTNLTQSTIEYKPEPGKIILFPSWAAHSVRANMTNNTRISISFNIKV
jgi:uncharacterized protein (TIGR02466 family)